MSVIFWGAGNYGKAAWKRLEKEYQLFMDECMAFADNNSDLWGKEFCGRIVINPLNIEKYNPDIIVITSIYNEAIRKQMINELKIPECKIYSFDDYLRKCYAEQIYGNLYIDSENNKKEKPFNTQNVVIYTAITGNYDVLREPLFVSENLTYVCITNNPDIQSNVWNIEYIKDDFIDNVHLARHIKMNPQEFFPDYETSVWVDGKYQILDDLRLYISLYQKQSNILCFPHPERKCICDEVGACIWDKKGNKKDMVIQVSDYLKKGYPLDNGLYDTGCMVRVHNDDRVKILMKIWEKELCKYSIRDQLSFPYVCWLKGFKPDICDLDINKNQWLLQKREIQE